MLFPQYQQLSHDYVLYNICCCTQSNAATFHCLYSGVIIDIFKTENQFSEES